MTSFKQPYSSPQEALEHFGVKGMHWGVRRDRPEGVSARTNREAKKDAEEFTRAKLFYGEGAGTRRKLIKAKVEAKSSRDSTYKKAFDHHLSKTDLDKRAEQARAERRRKDTTKSVTKTAKGVHRQLTGGFGSVSLASAIIATGYVAARNTGADKVIKDTLKKTWSNIRSRNMNDQQVRDWLRQQNIVV